MNHPAKPSPFVKSKLLATLAAIAVSLSACGSGNTTSVESEPPLQGADIGGEFELTSSDGKTVKWSDFEGQYRIVYFGYAFCPDVCPTDVQRMSEGLKQFGEAEPELEAKVQPIFITVDPARDTPDVLEEFTSAFSDKLIGLRGTEEEIRETAKVFRVTYARGADTSDGSYLMDHQNITFLFGPKGEPLSMLPTDLGATRLPKNWPNG